jgi:hypothetical protein
VSANHMLQNFPERRWALSFNWRQKKHREIVVGNKGKLFNTEPPPPSPTPPMEDPQDNGWFSRYLKRERIGTQAFASVLTP